MSTDKKNIEISMHTKHNTVSRVVQIRIGPNEEEQIKKDILEFKEDWPLLSAAYGLRIEVRDYK